MSSSLQRASRLHDLCRAGPVVLPARRISRAPGPSHSRSSHSATRCRSFHAATTIPRGVVYFNDNGKSGPAPAAPPGSRSARSSSSTLHTGIQKAATGFSIQTTPFTFLRNTHVMQRLRGLNPKPSVVLRPAGTEDVDDMAVAVIRLREELGLSGIPTLTRDAFLRAQVCRKCCPVSQHCCIQCITSRDQY